MQIVGIKIDLEKCTGYGLCEPACPFGLIEIENDKARINEGCNLCGACVEACPEEAIIIEEVVQEVSEGFNGVWVCPNNFRICGNQEKVKVT